MYVIVWTYDVTPGAAPDFVEVYGPEGAWAQLFRRAPGFHSVELFRDGDGRYLTLDRWTTEAAFEAFQAAHGEAYRALDVELAGLTLGQTRIGGFTTP